MTLMMEPLAVAEAHSAMERLDPGRAGLEGLEIGTHHLGRRIAETGLQVRGVVEADELLLLPEPHLGTFLKGLQRSPLLPGIAQAASEIECVPRGQNLSASRLGAPLQNVGIAAIFLRIGTAATIET